jgi:prepilin signal peptidase PulO-like enzyme (type II secretory pathway)
VAQAVILVSLALGSVAGLVAGEASRALARRRFGFGRPDRLSVALAAGSALVFTWWTPVHGDFVNTLLRTGLLALLALVLASDLRERAVYPPIVYPAIVGLAAAAPVLGTSVVDALLGGAISGGVFALLHLVARVRYGSGALGEGDVTVAVLMGVVVGALRLPAALLLVSVIGAGLALLAVVRARSMRATFPYAPALSLAAVATLLVRAV